MVGTADKADRIDTADLARTAPDARTVRAEAAAEQSLDFGQAAH